MKTIRTLKISPKRHPELCQIPCNKEGLQKKLQAKSVKDLGILELEKGIYVIYHKYGAIDGLPPNRYVHEKILSGDFFLVQIKDGKTVSDLPEEVFNRYLVRFWEPENHTEEEAFFSNLKSLFDGILKNENPLL